ncbi:MAG: hypothetical protein F6K36_09735 [Symploca sp. SIO3C6]|uniref:Uncharacterized protein n=1 Tax=Symploca sp. SIO1C4 TaxID=2607765 RepID=A0A6B3NED2_9CYAN|nr:hypothetical protein [Symploca sp. SIO3C6]NER29963.1 hypothetical protein [Symploca sp. SIO1C4]
MLKKPLSSIITASALAIPMIALSGSATLAQRSYQIRNTTGHNIINLYVSSSSSQDWGLDSLETNSSLRNGESVNIKLSSDCLYDIKVELEDGREIEKRQVDTCASSFLTLAPESISDLPASTTVAATGSSGTGGFFCDTSSGIPETRYQNSSGSSEVWIRWSSNFFSTSGYDPLSRCQAVSGRLENYRRNGKLNYMGVGQMNGQNIICTAIKPGNCLGLVYTLKPQQSPLETLQQFMQHRVGVVGTAPLYESEDGEEETPFVDVRPFLEGNTNTAPALVSPNQNNTAPSPEQLRDGGELRRL